MDLRRWLRENLDRAGAWAFVAVGVIVLIVGYHGVAHTAYPAEQLPYVLSGGIGGALLIAFGATLLISADLRDEWHKLDRIEKRLEAADAAAAAADEADNEPAMAERRPTRSARTRRSS